MKNRCNYLFLFLVVLIILFGSLTLIREQKDDSVNENRVFQKFEHLTLNSYINGTYQKNLEGAMSDQFIGGETIKLKLKSLLRFLNYNTINESICRGNYVNLNSYYSFNCGNSLISKYENITDDIENRIKNRIGSYNKLNDYVDTYYYFITTSPVYNFEKNDYSINLIKMLEDNLKGNYKLAALTFDNYNEYTKYFYKTDHHWNHVGTHKAYEQIVSMIKPNDELLKPVDEIKFENTIFYGSSARISQILDYKENFKVYKYNFPSMKIINNRTIGSYGSPDKYYNGDIDKDKFANHYASFYGGDSAEVVFEANKSKHNLLILGNSFSNSVNKLIASHFNKTYDVDLRHYENEFNEKFNIKDYIVKNDIDKVLFIMDYSFIKDFEFDIEWED